MVVVAASAIDMLVLPDLKSGKAFLCELGVLCGITWCRNVFPQ